VSERSLDDRRIVLFAGAAGTAALSGAVQYLVKGEQVWWEISSALVCGATALVMRRLPAWRQVAMGALAIFFLVTAPMVAILVGRPTDLVVLLALPLALTVLFIDRPPIVVTICITGVVVNPVTLFFMHWQMHDIVHATAAMVALYAAGVLGAREFDNLRRQEREQQAALHRTTAIQLQSERLVVLGTLAAGVAHEVANPLAFVLANVSHLRSSEPADEVERAQIWKETEDGLRRIAALVDDLKGLARQGSNELRPLTVQPLLKQAARLANLRGKPVKVELDVPIDLPEVTANEQRLLQVVINLVVNACEAMDANNPTAAKLRLSAQSTSSGVSIHVDDNGPGVPAPMRETIFEPFYTSRPGVGTGLGLALSREYVGAFKGTLVCDASPLGGARFTLSLPAAAS